uniref:Uncharacterized protein n=1 Tax=Coccidioides posadasii RMSCC 3488 TaxID=454284 RepID=A0A0J6FBK3_COCPO|nr:hypothetical protein CPAG_02678 [Coccidioides posadasii RMSCC 3488]
MYAVGTASNVTANAAQVNLNPACASPAIPNAPYRKGKAEEQLSSPFDSPRCNPHVHRIYLGSCSGEERASCWRSSGLDLEKDEARYDRIFVSPPLLFHASATSRQGQSEKSNASTPFGWFGLSNQQEEEEEEKGKK